jgi:hypothetical protein
MPDPAASGSDPGLLRAPELRRAGPNPGRPYFAARDAARAARSDPFADAEARLFAVLDARRNLLSDRSTADRSDHHPSGGQSATEGSPAR